MEQNKCQLYKNNGIKIRILNKGLFIMIPNKEMEPKKGGVLKPPKCLFSYF